MQRSCTAAAAVDVRVLYTEGCPHTPGTLALIREVAAEMGIQICLGETVIESEEHAQESKFLGSPTVLVGGLDIDPAARKSTMYGFV